MVRCATRVVGDPSRSQHVPRGASAAATQEEGVDMHRPNDHPACPWAATALVTVATAILIAASLSIAPAAARDRDRGRP